MSFHWRFLNLALIFAAAIFSGCTQRFSVGITVHSEEMPVRLAVRKFLEMAHVHNIPVSDSSPRLHITARIDSNLPDEAYRIFSVGREVNLTGGDAAGLAYGIYHIKEQLQQGARSIENIDEQPHYAFRALKFNLPWDSYRRGEALQLHYETCRDTAFWEKFLDMMVESRFNKLTLWNLHPFNYLVKNDKYPEACGFSDIEMAGWKQFWNSLFRMAKERAIETYLVNWNIFVSPGFAKAHNVATYSIDGTYFTDGDTSAIITDYTREVVKQVIDEYPDLTGLGITLGEAMFGMSAEQRERWLLDGFVQGMREASRKIKFIHRVPLTPGHADNTTMFSVERITRNTLDTLTCVDGPIIIELKYNWSHGHSSPYLFKVHGGKISDAYWNPPPTNYKLAWMVRNEDFFILRWGQPDFIRQHIALNSQDHVTGYFVGSECYIPAVDYFTKAENVPWKYAFERQWGRLLYNPGTPEECFRDAFELRYAGKGRRLFEAQQMVGRVPLIVASYLNATWDYTLYSEGMVTIMGQQTTQLISLRQICETVPMDTVLMSIKESAASIEAAELKSPKITSWAMADSIEDFCQRAIRLVADIDPGGNISLAYEKADILTWAHLGLYFAYKLRAATDYQIFVQSADAVYHAKAVVNLEQASAHWQEVAGLTSGIYHTVPLMHYERNDDNYFHWKKVQQEVIAEVEWLKGQYSAR